MEEKQQRIQHQRKAEVEAGLKAIEDGFKVACVWPPIHETPKEERQQKEKERQRKFAEELRAQGENDQRYR